MILLTDSMDWYTASTDVVKRWPGAITGAAPALVATGSRYATQCLQLPAGTGQTHLASAPGSITITSGATLNFAFGMQTAGGTGPLLSLVAGTTNLNGLLTISPTGALNGIALNAAATVLGTSTALVANNAWHWVEGQVVFSTTAGRFVLLIDGVQQFSFSGVTWDGTSLPTACAFWDITTNALNLDDIVIWNATTPGLASFPNGLVRIGLQRPASDGAPLQWTPATGTSHFAMVDGQGSGSTWNESGTAGAADEYGQSAFPFIAQAILTSVQYAYLQNAGSGSISARQNVISGTAPVSEGSTVALTASPVMYGNEFPVDPNTSAAWTQIALNAALRGVDVP